MKKTFSVHTSAAREDIPRGTSNGSVAASEVEMGDLRQAIGGATTSSPACASQSPEQPICDLDFVPDKSVHGRGGPSSFSRKTSSSVMNEPEKDSSGSFFL